MSTPKPNAWPAIKPYVCWIAKNLMELPLSPVWTHEKAIYHLISAPKGPTFGEHNSLSCVIKGFVKGYCGDRKTKQHVMLGYCVDLQTKENGSHISYQEMGDNEPFSRGEDLLDPSLVMPKYFRTGKPVVDLSTQIDIVKELIGQAVDEPDPVNRRHVNNFMAFVRGDEHDGRYRRKEVPAIVYKFHNAFH